MRNHLSMWKLTFGVHNSSPLHPLAPNTQSRCISCIAVSPLQEELIESPAQITFATVVPHNTSTPNDVYARNRTQLPQMARRLHLGQRGLPQDGKALKWQAA